MKVRCTELIDSRGARHQRSGWLTLGKIYHVLEVVHDVHGKWLFRLVGDDVNGVALFRSVQFEIVSARVADVWIVKWNDSGGFKLTTQAWSQPGFWERFYDRDPEAEKIFEEDKTKIIQADP